MERTVYVVLFKGIPYVAFHKEKDLAAYLDVHDTTLEKVREDMESNPMASWEVYTVEIRLAYIPDYVGAASKRNNCRKSDDFWLI